MQDEKKGVAPRSVACRASVEGALRGVFVSFSILILNALSFFFSFCVRRLLHRGASSEGSRRILFAGWRRDHTPGGRGTSSHHVVFFSILIPNTLSLFFSAHRLLHWGTSPGGIASDPLRAGGASSRDHSPGGSVTSSPHVSFFSILVPNTLPLFFCACSYSNRGRASEGSCRILCGPAARGGTLFLRLFILVSFLF